MATDVRWQQEGRAGGAVSRAERRPPTCFGSKRCANNRARGAAKGLFQVAPGLCQRPLVAAAFTQELAAPVPAHRCRGCSARGSSPPPTRPAAWPFFGGGWAGIPPDLRQWRPTCFGSKGGGWVGQLPRCGSGAQLCLGSTGGRAARNGPCCQSLAAPPEEVALLLGEGIRAICVGRQALRFQAL